MHVFKIKREKIKKENLDRHLSQCASINKYGKFNPDAEKSAFSPCLLVCDSACCLQE